MSRREYSMKIKRVIDEFIQTWNSYEGIVGAILNESLVHDKKRGFFNGSEFNRYRDNSKLKPLVVLLDDSGGYTKYIRPVNIEIESGSVGKGSFKILFNVNLRGRVYEISGVEKYMDETVSGEVDMYGYNDYEELDNDVLDFLSENKVMYLNYLKDKIDNLDISEEGHGVSMVMLRARSPISTVYLTTKEQDYKRYIERLSNMYEDKNNLKKNEDIIKQQRKLILIKIREEDRRMVKVLTKHNDKVDEFKLSGVEFDRGLIGRVNGLDINQDIIYINNNTLISILPHRVDIILYNKNKSDSKLINAYNILNYSYKENEKKLNSEKVRKALGMYHSVVVELLKNTKLR